jgi:hypothetical protein
VRFLTFPGLAPSLVQKSVVELRHPAQVVPVVVGVAGQAGERPTCVSSHGRELGASIVRIAAAVAIGPVDSGGGVVAAGCGTGPARHAALDIRRSRAVTGVRSSATARALAGRHTFSATGWRVAIVVSATADVRRTCSQKMSLRQWSRRFTCENIILYNRKHVTERNQQHTWTEARCYGAARAASSVDADAGSTEASGRASGGVVTQSRNGNIARQCRLLVNEAALLSTDGKDGRKHKNDEGLVDHLECLCICVRQADRKRERVGTFIPKCS